ncbi:pentatricopeptide repeat-containing protein At3g18110, chloroplastic-like isoform X1 [Pyrus x bretschneideri]|uniref:pentatricopeptide repeat-containing protein At3g18110, chloroplastic-like isoform X1 n=1 Tax=Pyrus x bretschneideri TaxID=225117 RepID=UPI00202DE7E4|nr:pentatricopeptide repeat-containing protein At3g18110, chloroplastic-like isoform X1 [Pyrus x bretschneideri]
MALVCRVLSAARRGLKHKASASSPHSRRWLSNQTSFLLGRLVEEPNSRIKSLLSSDEFSALQSSDFSWESLVSSLASSSSPEKSRLVLEWKLEKLLEANERDHDRYSELISLCGKIHNLPLAMQVFSSMEANGIKPTSAVFNSLIRVCFSSGNVLTALSLYEIMKSSEGFKPDSDTYDAFMFAFSKLGNADSVQAWYSAKKAAGFTSGVQTYEYLISGCIKSNNFELGDRFYEEMVLSGHMPSLPVLESMVEGICKQRSFDLVIDFLKMVLDAGLKINEKMAEMVVGLYIELKMMEKLEELLVILTEANQVSEVLLLVHCGIIRLNAALDRLDDVEYSVGRMLKQGLSFKHQDDVEKVICSYFRCSAHDRLELFLERIEGSYELTKSTYDLVVAGYRRAGLSDRLNDMKLAEKRF